MGTDRDLSLPKKYILVEFPYPSGLGLHIGHAFTFTGGDVYARFNRAKGFKVMFPMGWDAFGLPTENHAIKTKQRPQDVTKNNTEMYKKQMKRLAFSFDWEREVNTTDPAYYKWTQWIFIKLFEKGLAYKKEMPINWCPSCKTGLANEEVIDGKCERCGAEVSRRNISQWVVKITDYADRLIDGLSKTDFIDKVKQAQINWIDRKEWIDITYDIDGIGDKVTVATTRPDTNFGATFIVLAPEHQLVNKLLKGEIKTNEDLNKIKSYVVKARNKSDLERQQEVIGRDKTGVFTGLYAINQLTGYKMPIWITDFVLSTVGTGAVVGVPGHDVRDFEFAKQFGLKIIRVVVGSDGKTGLVENKDDVQEKEGKMINSGFLDGMDIHQATKKIMDYLEEKGWGKRSIRYHLRDWIFSRQHYWGEPIPMIRCTKCAVNHNFQFSIFNFQTNFSDPKFNEIQNSLKQYIEVNKIDLEVLRTNPGWYPVAKKDLPIVLPEVDAYEPTDTGESPLAKMTDWVKCKCPVCGGEAKRETDTMPNWAGSDWYYLAYCVADKLERSFADAQNDKFDMVGDVFSDSQNELKKWMPVDVYIGGDEHNTLHLLYSRFIYQFLYDLGVVPVDIPEPYFKRMSHGVILGPDGARMSKSRGNIVVPETVADKYGVDVVRCYLMFMGPFDATMAWNEKTLMGVKRFLDKFYNFVRKMIDSKQIEKNIDSTDEVRVIINKLVAGVGADIESFKFNTALAKIMEALNRLGQIESQIGRDEVNKLVQVLSPFAPYITEELWQALGNDKSVFNSQWPVVEEKYLVTDQVNLPVAINGKTRGQVIVAKEDVGDENKIVALVKKDANLDKWLAGKKIDRTVYVKGKMLNFVVK